MANPGLAELQREQAEHEAAAASAREKIATIEEEERRQREAKEAKEREFVSLQSQLKKCQGWILFVKKEIAENRRAAAVQVTDACLGQGEVQVRIRGTLQELAAWELELSAFQEFEVSVQAKIEGVR